MSDDRAAYLGAAEALAIKALSIAPENALAHLCLGVAQMYTNRAAQGIPELQRALAIDRNLAAAHAYIGLAKNFVGRGEETAGHIEDALRLSPRDTDVGSTSGAFRKSFLATTKKPSRSYAARSRPTGISRPHISTSPSPWRNWVRSMKHCSKRGRGFPSIPPSPSAAIAATRRATTRLS